MILFRMPLRYKRLEGPRVDTALYVRKLTVKALTTSERKTKRNVVPFPCSSCFWNKLVQSFRTCFITTSSYCFIVHALCCASFLYILWQEVAGANQTYPSTLGMVGVRLHVSNEQTARMLKLQAMKEGGVEYSLVSKRHFFLHIDAFALDVFDQL